MRTMFDDNVNLTVARELLACEFAANRTPTLEDPFCRSRFDSWSCWPDTPAGHTANHSCPVFVVGFDPNRFAYHKCEEDGTWFVHPESNHTWANYTLCVNKDDYTFRENIILIYTVGYSVSLVALLVSLLIFIYFKSLRCARITIHMNLFSAFAINNFLWLLWYNCVLHSIDVIEHNPWWCILLHILLYFFLISTYSWMLCEGLYLHTVLVSAFVSETRLVRYMLLLGWGIPTKTTIIYSLTRYFYGTTVSDTQQCWMDDCSFTRILQIPVAITVILNAVFLINILRVLLVKLKHGTATGAGSGASRASLQALRATMLLVPLLGLNYLIIPFRPEPNHPWEYVYEIVSALTASMQGLCVAILFCFFNGEVITQMKRRWATVTFRPRESSCTATTTTGQISQFVRSNYGANGEKV
ncbi:calcitonin gene-related peptide type 1 receptor-like [Coccinella septempunctata]|uniref:calcitonin gene-related peptide type 1 receptor-like n=1 Tax=Coccinella septempunctata TaxID=41139 RepID=UPI001D063F14|nr:calcitonin gene-related peptide type 1 receptor-like [Coccinella septempunctata]